MKRSKLFLVAVGVILAVNSRFVLEPNSAWALDSSLYKLTAESNYLEGCFDPCMCPILMNSTLQGSFILTPVFPAEEGAQFEVWGVDWQFIQGDQTIFVTGSGLYQLDSAQHRLTLDLQVGDDPVQRFDSGLVPLPSEFPGIFIAVALNGFFCYDYVFEITALPAPVKESISSWGSLKSIFR